MRPDILGNIAGKSVDVIADTLLDIGRGPTGFVSGMLHSEEAKAPVLDQTRTQEYQDAKKAIQAGRGDIRGRPGNLWQFVSGTAETPRQSVQRMDAEQKATDVDMERRYRQNLTPDERVLADTNRYKLAPAPIIPHSLEAKAQTRRDEQVRDANLNNALRMQIPEKQALYQLNRDNPRSWR